MRRFLLALMLSLIPSLGWAACQPQAARTGEMGCQPVAPSMAGTDSFEIWQPDLYPKSATLLPRDTFVTSLGISVIYASGLKADGVTSDDVALKANIDACAAKGAHLILPPGRITLTGAAGPITLQNCHIEGAGIPGGKTPTASQGTIILLKSTTVKPFLAASNWAMSGINFFWPGQTTGSVAYPPLLNVQAPAGGCNWRFFNNVVANAYDFVDDTPGPGICEADWFIHDNTIYVMHYGISSAGQGDEINISRNLWTPGAWFNLDPANGPTAYLTARKNNWAFHVKNSAGFAWNVMARDNAFFAWRGGFLIEATGVVGISDVEFMIDGMNTVIDTSAGGTWAVGNGLKVIGGCTTFDTSGPGAGPAAPCFKLGSGSLLELKDSHLVASGSIIEGVNNEIILQNVSISNLGSQDDGTDYYAIHATGAGNIVVQNSLIQGNVLPNKAHAHGIKTDVIRPILMIQGNRMGFLQEDLDIQTAANTIITGNNGFSTNGPSSLLIAGTNGVQFANNFFDKPPNAILSNCGGATVANGAFSGFFQVGATNPTTTCTITFPFPLFGSGAGACQFQQSINVTLWAGVSSSTQYVVQSSADFHSTNVFFNCRAAQ